MIINENVLNSFRLKYSTIHPLIIQRTVDKVETLGELFYILEDFPNTYPVVWNVKTKRWSQTDDITQEDNFDTTLGDIIT